MPNTRFNPAVHGFHFSNNDITWSFGPFKSKFLCGGMAYASLDYFASGMAIPPDTTAPPEGTPLHSYIYDRQVKAHLNTAPKFTGTFIPVVSALFVGINELNVNDEFAKLNSILAAGTPIPICLSTLGAGHHVLAIGCNPAPPIAIFAYDPNAPEKIAIVQQLQGGMFKNSHSSRLWHAFFVDSDYRRKTPTIVSGQSNWRSCRKCQGLFFNGHPTNGACPKGLSHDVVGSGNYVLAVGAGSGQSNWRWCSACEGLFFAGSGVNGGMCPRGGVHVGGSSGNYALAQDTGSGQGNWRSCRVCHGLFFAGNNSLGVCPGNPNGHNGSSSGNYVLPMASG